MALRSKPYLLTATLVFSFLSASAQNTRIQDNSTIGWYTTSLNFKLSQKWGFHTDYQWRRTHLGAQWQQSFLSGGFSYNAAPRLQLRAGYNWVESYAYGTFPLNGFGKQFTEHRLFESVTLSDHIGRFDITNRLMLEQRWIGTYSSRQLEKEDHYNYLNRLRYMLRLQTPLGKGIRNVGLPYVAAWNEVFIGFGENVGENVFDQNRLALLLGLKFSEKFSLEGGYFNQTAQLGREINGRNVFQYNNGIIVSAGFNFGK